MVAVVTGATRRAGRGIALELGMAGATVYCTGRSTRGNPSSLNEPETIEETAEMVDAYGGKGIWAKVDHTVISEVDILFERVIQEQGRLDLLVNNVSGRNSNDPFLKTDLAHGLRQIDQGGHSHIIASHIAARWMAKSSSGLIISISDNEWDQFYAMEKALINKMVTCIADELRPLGITVVSLLPGAFWRCFGIMTEEELRVAVQQNPEVGNCHTPRYVGRGVVALATDPNVLAKTGTLINLGDIAREYAFTDIDGQQHLNFWP
jgi:NAD(P)-dependent dehydrogenase (short-subunit alcohol dehydrogenase family)